MRILVGLLVLGLVATQADAQTAVGKPDDLIAGRQAGMSLQSALAATMKRTVDAKGDAKPFKDGADAISKFAKAIPGLFAPGTDKGLNTRALPVVWSDRAGFEQAASNLDKAAQVMATAAASGNEGEFAQAFQTTGQACAACHRTYRSR
jgi:cytochrome c556